MRQAAIVRAATFALFAELPLYEVPFAELPFAKFTLNLCHNTYRSILRQPFSPNFTANIFKFKITQIGDWKNYFSGDKLKEWDAWIAENLEGTDIKMVFE
jgi:hypothetical protein